MMKKQNFRTHLKSAAFFRTAALVSLFPLFISAENSSTVELNSAELKNSDDFQTLRVADTEEKKDHFFTGSKLSGGLYLMNRARDRINDNDKFVENLRHSSTMASIGLKSRNYGGFFNYQFAGYAVLDLAQGVPSGANQENEFSFAGSSWSRNFDGQVPRNGLTAHRATANFEFPFGLSLSAGLGQFGVEGIIGNNWSYLPGSYTGGQAEFNLLDFLILKYALVNEYKAPWFQKVGGFSTKNAWADPFGADTSKIDYLQGLSAKIKFGDALNLTMSIGNSQEYMKAMFGKLATSLDVADGFNASYQFYGSKTDDKWEDSTNSYDGLAQLHAITTALNVNLWNFRLEGTYVIAEGQLGNYLPRLTRGYGNSQGGLQVWWDLRSDWNENGEKAIFANVSRKLDDLLGTPGWTLGVGGAYGGGAEYLKADLNPDDSTAVNREDGVEYAWKVDLSFTTDIGRFKGATFMAHYMQYTNDQNDLGNWAFPNMFRSEKDFMLKVILPFGVDI